MTRLLREPLLHFFAIGAIVFALFAAFDDAPPPVEAQTIVVTSADVSRLVNEFEATWRRPPSASELDNLIEGLVREEVYVREAIALGLDQDDTIIRRRLQQKMEFLSEAGAATVSPDDTALQAHLSENAERFARPALIAFQQFLLADDVEGSRLAGIRTDLAEGRLPIDDMQPSLLPRRLRASPRQVVDATFGTGVFDRLFELPVGEWAGPVDSGFGQHFVFVEERGEAVLPSLDSVRARVELDWRAETAAELREARFEAMRSRYEVSRPDAAHVPSE